MSLIKTPTPYRDLRMTIDRLEERSNSDSVSRSVSPVNYPQINSGSSTTDSFEELAINIDEDLSSEDENNCRICFEGKNEGELISPCRCAGTINWVHVHCLDTLRAIDSVAFQKCKTCHYRYRVTEQQTVQKNCCDRINIYFVNHTYIFYILDQLFIFGMAYTLSKIDGHQVIPWVADQIKLPTIVPHETNKSHWLYKMFLYNQIFYYYLLVTLIFCLFWLVITVMNFILGIKRNRWLYARKLCQYWPMGLCFFVTILLAFWIHIFIGTFLLSIGVQLVLRIHYHLLERLNQTRRQIVLPYNRNEDQLSA